MNKQGNGASMKRCLYALACAVTLSALCSTIAFAQQFEREPRPSSEPKPRAYYAGSPVDFRLVIGLPPAVDSSVDDADLKLVRALQSVPDERWQSAELDDALVYPRFDSAFGRAVDRRTSTALVQLLDRAMADVAVSIFAAKAHFQRPRPYQRSQLQRVCGDKSPPKPEMHPMGGSSYPSGHSAYGWATAMVLARIAPDRAEALMARAAEYAESRVVCGAHFPSDVTAGQVIAAAVVSRLDSSPEFQADLARALKEVSAR